jgi:hypothetical protein
MLVRNPGSPPQLTGASVSLSSWLTRQQHVPESYRAVGSRQSDYWRAQEVLRSI